MKRREAMIIPRCSHLYGPSLTLYGQSGGVSVPSRGRRGKGPSHVACKVSGSERTCDTSI